MCAAEGVDGSKMIVFGSKMGGRKWGVMSDEEKKVSVGREGGRQAGRRSKMEWQG